jgi:hypothetical protein
MTMCVYVTRHMHECLALGGVGPGQGKTGQDRAGQDRTGQDRTGQDTTDTGQESEW